MRARHNIHSGNAIDFFAPRSAGPSRLVQARSCGHVVYRSATLAAASNDVSQLLENHEQLFFPSSSDGASDDRFPGEISAPPQPG